MKLLKRLSKKIADFQAVIILTVSFFLVAPLFAAIAKLTKKEKKLSWDKWSIPSDTLNDTKKQY